MFRPDTSSLVINLNSNVSPAFVMRQKRSILVKVPDVLELPQILIFSSLCLWKMDYTFHTWATTTSILIPKTTHAHHPLPHRLVKPTFIFQTRKFCWPKIFLSCLTFRWAFFSFFFHKRFAANPIAVIQFFPYQTFEGQIKWTDDGVSSYGIKKTRIT